jgi:1-deoxy-D-xylulose-5-phosphate synthase
MTRQKLMIEANGLLKDIHYPQDLRKLDKSQLNQVCEDLRHYLINNASVHGGHFAASLGVVDLTVALHYVFDTPKDRIVWDVGHQAYGHKILTGRRERFHTNRTYGGIAPFPKRDESEFDTFGVGHSSTSISAALGMAYAAQLRGDKEAQHVAVIGDGSLTGGMAFEGLNNAGFLDTNILVILNDNCMSIDPNVGALKEYLTDITVSKAYNKVRDEVWDLLGKLKGPGQHAREAVSRLEKSVKGMVSAQSNLFESLKFKYYGPIDGHDVQHLVKVLNELKHIPGPKLLHLSTVKGKGYKPAEEDPLKWHAPAGKFDVASGTIQKKADTGPTPPKFQDVFGHTLLELARENPQIVGITPAMPSGSSMKIMMDEMPDRALDVGICEQHAVTFSAGLATEGKKVFCNIYSSFMQRAFDQVVHDVAIQKLPVVFCLDRGGLVGADGATHHGAYDIAYFRCIPELIVASPLNEQELRNMMYSASMYQEGPISIRYPRGEGVMSDWRKPLESIEIGKGQILRKGSKIAVLSLGPVGNTVAKVLDQLAAEGMELGHYDMRFVKPLDGALLQEVYVDYDAILTVEDGCLQGGFGSAVMEWAMDNGVCKPMRRLGIPDRFIDHGTPLELHEECGYGPKGIERTLRTWYAEL